LAGSQPLKRGNGKAHECDDGGTERLCRKSAARYTKTHAAEGEKRERDDPQPGESAAARCAGSDSPSPSP
jgi:hypothetical protein